MIPEFTNKASRISIQIPPPQLAQMKHSGIIIQILPPQLSNDIYNAPHP